MVGGFFRSTNYGSTFTNISSTVNNAVLYQDFYVNGSTVSYFLLQQSIVAYMTLTHQQLIFVDAVLPLLFYTVDEGATFTAVDLAPSTLITTTVVYHPTRDGWMLMQDQSNTVCSAFCCA